VAFRWRSGAPDLSFHSLHRWGGFHLIRSLVCIASWEQSQAHTGKQVVECPFFLLYIFAYFANRQLVTCVHLTESYVLQHRLQVNNNHTLKNQSKACTKKCFTANDVHMISTFRWHCQVKLHLPEVRM
jgi:hypothetical protein